MSQWGDYLHDVDGGYLINPSAIIDAFWVWADSPSPPTEDDVRGGKWMIFSSPERHDDAWALVRDATEGGSLGIQAKAATAKVNPLAKGSKSKLICVYTRDYEDQEELRRVLRRLRELGFVEKMFYKTNQATRSGTYGAGATRFVAQAGSCDFAANSPR
jgi:Domain of unknown function (DUF1917)